MPAVTANMPEVVRHAALARRDEVGQRSVRLVVGDDLLLPQHRQRRQHRAPRVVLVERRCRRRRCSPARSRRRRARVSSRPSTMRVEQRAARCRTARAPPRRARGCSRIAGKRPFSSQAVKKNVQSMYGDQLRERHLDRPPPEERRRGDRLVVPVDPQPVGARLLVRQQRLLAARRVLLAQRLLRLAVRRVERRPARRSSRLDTDVHRARRVEHVHDRSAVLRRDLHRRVLPARRRAADQQRQREAAPLHLLARRAPSRRATA